MAHALVAACGRPLVVVLTARPDAVHVEEGWPGGGDPPAAARVLTYGASPGCGDAVADLLLGRITGG